MLEEFSWRKVVPAIGFTVAPATRGIEDFASLGIHVWNELTLVAVRAYEPVCRARVGREGITVFHR